MPDIPDFLRSRLVLRWIGFTVLSLILTGIFWWVANPVFHEIASTLVRGLIVLFTVTMTFTVFGLQLASSRYSHRFEPMIISNRTFWSFFGLFVFAIIVGIFSMGIPQAADSAVPVFYVLIFLSFLSVLSIYNYIRWIVQQLQPDNLAEGSLRRMDTTYADRVIAERSDDYLFTQENYDPLDLSSFEHRNTPFSLIDDDPLGPVVDVVLSAVEADDTTTAKDVVHDLEDRFESLVEEVHGEGEHGFSQMKMLTTHYLGGFNQIFRKARSHGDSYTSYEVLKAVNQITVFGIASEVRGVSTESMRLFGSLASELPGEADSQLVHDIGTEFNRIQRALIDQLSSNGDMRSDLNSYIRWREIFTMEAIDAGLARDMQFFTLWLTQVRLLVNTLTNHDGVVPSDPVHSMGRIGRKLARRSVEEFPLYSEELMDPGEWAVIELVALQDELEAFDTGIIEEQVEMIEDELNSKDERIHDSLVEKYPEIDEEMLPTLWRFFRRFRGRYTVDELINYLDDNGFPLSSDEADQLVDALQDVELMTYDDSSEDYSTNLPAWDPQRLID